MKTDSKQFQRSVRLIAVLFITLAAAAQVKPQGFSQREKFACSAVAGWLRDADSSASSVAVPQRC